MASNTFKSDADKIQTLADFSKAAYAVQSWENKSINDPSPGAQETYDRLILEGWRPLDLNIATTSVSYSSSSTRFTTTNKMDAGFYTYANAAALVATSGNSLVLSFRGTNDYSEKGSTNSLDPTDKFHPDYDHWKLLDMFSSDSMTKHYQYFASLFSALESYLQSHSEIENVYVTGHSMGGAMALEYMSHNPSSYSSSYNLESITFAASPFVESRFWLTGTPTRKDYRDDGRITQIEIFQDSIEDSWAEFIFENNRPGKVVRLYGDQTLDAPDTTLGLISSRKDNHNMNYYQEMAHGIDQSGWSQITGQASLYQTVDVYLAGKQVGSEFIVSENNDVLNGTNFDLVFGGEGNDVIYANNNSKVNGGDGVDTLVFSGNKSQYSMYLNDDYESYAYSGSLFISFNNFERLRFADTKLALDVEGNAGDVVKVLGAMFGSVAAQNKYIVGEWLREIDSGIGYDGLVDKALDMKTYYSDESFVELIYYNVTNEFASNYAVNHYVSLLDNGWTRKDLAEVAIDYQGNLNNIDFVGLSESGIEYV